MKTALNLEYGCIQGTYWMIYGVIGSFASVFLLGQGYSNSEIGIILAAANIAAVVLQPIVADFADRAEKISLLGITEVMTIMMMVMTVGLFVLRGKSAGLSIIFVLLIAWHTVLQPLFNSLTFKLEECGIPVNFGVARSFGSLAYSVLIAFLGTMVERRGVMVLPKTGEVVMLMLLLSLLLTGFQYRKAKQVNRERGVLQSEETEPEEKIDLREFIHRNRAFFLVNLGVIGLYFSNSILNNYMMQIVANVGGTSEDMGRIFSVMAFLEIPTMLFFDRLHRRFSCQLMMKIAAIGFTLKIAMCCAAKSVNVILAAQAFQIISFALFLPAMVHFVDEMMTKGEAVKGQALFTMMITVTTIFSSLAGGIILDRGGAGMLTFVGTLMTAAGALVILLTVDRVKRNS